MEETLLEELNELREENKILRDSLTELRPEPRDGEAYSVEDLLKGFSAALGMKLDTAKEKIEPGKDKVTAYITEGMEKNPAPLMLAAFGAGYLLSRGLKGS